VFQVAQGDLGVELQLGRLEATLGQATLQRHLAALEADLVVTTGTGFLALVATASGLAQARTNAATHAALGVLGTGAGLNGVEFHVCLSLLRAL
jgi:hypothetical protein